MIQQAVSEPVVGRTAWWPSCSYSPCRAAGNRCSRSQPPSRRDL